MLFLQKNSPREVMRRQGFGLLMQKHLFHFHASSAFSFKNLVHTYYHLDLLLHLSCIKLGDSFSVSTCMVFPLLLIVFQWILEFQQILKEQPLDLPSKPPQRRTWRGSSVAPFGGNNMLVLYNCPSNSSSPYFVQVLHNEKPISVPVSLWPN